ncbi:MAG TPA: UDP-glucose--hexose-1-phosphate uridylyltransferase [Blastocatellia bacterium]|nr:UDP-glucose--hexose-1-phosphate uridylyltransferase [Blastocatellia bacterium]
MDSFLVKDHPHRRYNPMTREWVLVSPHRAERPWQGKIEGFPLESQAAYEPDCYLCPGNTRAGGVTNPIYTDTFVFDNDFSALKPDVSSDEINEAGLLIASSEAGRCRVVCFSPRHDLTLALMDVQGIRRVVDTWVQEFGELSGLPYINSVQVFENRGEMMGCSNPHPHGQIWANETLPNESAKELFSFGEYHARHRSSLLADYLELELKAKERVVCENEHFVALVPFWAVWPFETMLVSRRQITAFDELSDAERSGLADILKRITTLYDNLFRVSFPYTMGFHQRPTDGKTHPGFHFHGHFYPPLLRSAKVKKFMVGYELLAMPQRDIAPETAAERLRDASGPHYLAASQSERR